MRASSALRPRVGYVAAERAHDGILIPDGLNRMWAATQVHTHPTGVHGHGVFGHGSLCRDVIGTTLHHPDALRDQGIREHFRELKRRVWPQAPAAP
jgi:hypothetical protein